MKQTRRPVVRRTVAAFALSGLVVIAACDTGPGGTVDPDVVNGEEPDAGT